MDYSVETLAPGVPGTDRPFHAKETSRGSAGTPTAFVLEWAPADLFDTDLRSLCP